MRRVVVTGLGVVAPAGIGVDAFWKQITQGVSAVGRITKFDPAGLPSQIAAEVTGFDPEARRRCWEVVANLRATGTTIVLTTHYLDEAEHLADRVAILQSGRIRACGTPTELARQAGAEPRMELVQPSLEEIYLDLIGTSEGMS